MIKFGDIIKHKNKKSLKLVNKNSEFVEINIDKIYLVFLPIKRIVN